MNSLTLNPYLGLKRQNNKIVAAMFSNRQQIILDYDPALEKLLKIADTIPSERWLKELRSVYTVTDDEFEKAIHDLVELSILIPRNYIPEQDEIHARQDAFFVGMGLDGRKVRDKLKNSKIMIFGCGGIGGNLIEQLAVVGVSNFVLVDNDKLELSNTNRSVIYNSRDVGKSKVDVLKEWINSRVDNANVSTYCKQILGPQDIVELLAQHEDVNLVVDCMDNPDKYTNSVWVTEACWAYGTPHFICGGYDLHGGLIGQTCIPGHTPCAKCYASKYAKEQFNGYRTPKIAGSFMPFVRLVSSIQCAEIVRLLTSYYPPLYTDTTYNVDLTKMKFSPISIERDLNCSICATKGGV